MDIVVPSQTVNISEWQVEVRDSSGKIYSAFIVYGDLSPMLTVSVTKKY